MTGLKLNLGCGAKRFPDFVNVDKVGDPDVKFDLETVPWPRPNDSVNEILLIHVLEHLGQDPKVYLAIFQEMYRVCQAGARIRIVVPHFRHDFFFSDPTHVRAVTPEGLSLFSKKANRHWIATRMANTPLGVHLDVDLELVSVKLKPSEHWFRLHPERPVDMNLLQNESALHNNLIEQLEMDLVVIKE
ncbi:MAG: class I SAM-dependent methyltransferase [Isosphaeraceae bacterium]